MGQRDDGRDLVIKVDGIVVLNTRTVPSTSLQFVDTEIRIRRTYTDGKNSVLIRFEASNETLTPGLYGCRMVRS